MLRVMTLSSSGGALSAVMPGNRLSKPGSVWRPLHDRAAPSVTTPYARGRALRVRPGRRWRRVRRRLAAGWSCCCWLLALDELAAFEPGAGADERDQVRGVDHPPPALGGLDELERHAQGGGFGPVAL